MTETKRKNRIRYLIWCVLILFAFLLQSTDGLCIRISGTAVSFVLPLLTPVCMFEKEKSACWFGLFAGLLMDSISPVMVGYNALMLLILCTCIGFFTTNVVRNTLLTNLIVGSVFIFLYESLYWLFFIQFKQIIGASSVYFTVYLPNIILSALMIIPAFFIVRAIHRPLQTK